MWAITFKTIQNYCRFYKYFGSSDLKICGFYSYTVTTEFLGNEKIEGTECKIKNCVVIKDCRKLRVIE